MSDEKRTKLEKQFDRLESGFFKSLERIEELESLFKQQEKINQGRANMEGQLRKELSELKKEFENLRNDYTATYFTKLKRVESVLAKVVNILYDHTEFTEWESDLEKLQKELSGEIEYIDALNEKNAFEAEYLGKLKRTKPDSITLSREEWETTLWWLRVHLAETSKPTLMKWIQYLEEKVAK